MLTPRLRRIDQYGVVHYFHYGERDRPSSCLIKLNDPRLKDPFPLVEPTRSITCLECLALLMVYCDSSDCYAQVPVAQRYCPECDE